MATNNTPIGGLPSVPTDYMESTDYIESTEPFVPVTPPTNTSQLPAILAGIAATLSAVTLATILSNDCNSESDKPVIETRATEQEDIQNSVYAEGSGTTAQNGGEGIGHRLNVNNSDEAVISIIGYTITITRDSAE